MKFIRNPIRVICDRLFIVLMGMAIILVGIISPRLALTNLVYTLKQVNIE